LRHVPGMTSPTYKLIDLVGVSDQGTDDAIRSALTRAGETLKAIDWFEVLETRGVLNDGRVTFQVSVRVGFRLLTDDELRNP
jgi:flavin-binding protein dodecin